MTVEDRLRCAQQLRDQPPHAAALSAFVGLDGFIDDITHVVDKREHAQAYVRIPTIARLSERIANAVGKSTNIELVVQQTKIGGNGPIFANALACLGFRVTYLGALGYPNRHSVFNEFAARAEVHSIAEPGRTDALEFQDGKILFGQTAQFSEITWANVQSRYSREAFTANFSQAHLIGFVNWTMVPYMTELWEAVLEEVCPTLSGPRRHLFFDLADPEKRSLADIQRALANIGKFQRYFHVTLGLNEKEACEVGRALGVPAQPAGRADLLALAVEISRHTGIETVVVHPVAFALAVSRAGTNLVEGPLCLRPRITTGAGDHFNAGFCAGKLLGLEDRASLLLGVGCSGYYVRTANSPSLPELADFLRAWPVESPEPATART